MDIYTFLHTASWKWNTLQWFGRLSIQIWHGRFSVPGPFSNDYCFLPIPPFLLFPPKNHPSRPLATTCDSVLKLIQASVFLSQEKGEMRCPTWLYIQGISFLHCPSGPPAFETVTPANLCQTNAGLSLRDMPQTYSHQSHFLVLKPFLPLVFLEITFPSLLFSSP